MPEPALPPRNGAPRERTPARIVSLLPAATEIIAALGAWDRLVGVTHECDVPAQARRLARVTASRIDSGASPAEIDEAVRRAAEGGHALFDLDEVLLRSLEPDVIVTQGLCEVCAVSETEVQRVAASLPRPPQIVTLGARTLDDVLASIAAVAAGIGAASEGNELLAGLRVRMRRVHERLKAARAPRPRVAVIEWTDPLYVAGHWVPDMVRRAGGIDSLASSGEHSLPSNVVAVRDADPEWIVFAPCGFAIDRARVVAHEVLAREEWGWARSRRIAVMDGNAFTSRPCPRLVDGIEVLARIFNPDCFSPLRPEAAAILS